MAPCFTPLSRPVMVCTENTWEPGPNRNDDAIRIEYGKSSLHTPSRLTCWSWTNGALCGSINSEYGGINLLGWHSNAGLCSTTIYFGCIASFRFANSEGRHGQKPGVPIWPRQSWRVMANLLCAYRIRCPSLHRVRFTTLGSRHSEKLLCGARAPNLFLATVRSPMRKK